MTILSVTITLFLLMDSPGNVPIFLSVLGRLEKTRRRRAILREITFALIALLLFLFFGRTLLSSLGISAPALSVAGGVVLFLVALRMIFPGQYGSLTEGTDPDPWLVPLAVPLAAGPSSMAYVMLIATQEPDRIGDWALAIVMACVLGGLTIYTGDLLRRWIKDRALNLIERLMGIILVVIAIQMLMNGIGQYVQTLSTATP
ncbi:MULTISPECIES: MarC family protein [unclassified Haematospirillum]|uniref:MarC family protein n=1 Tax=unclassified Haematospirillum TaxID=2622088 RepID=UPI00143961B1|nr:MULTISPECIES: MarC family protein [unclassified Haematospirillum]NKD54717.1 MarC family protein [Haematospirillum sp. H4890]NKD74555.1 MarC family protein [Haematospirillum sp. H4485]